MGRRGCWHQRCRWKSFRGRGTATFEEVTVVVRVVDVGSCGSVVFVQVVGVALGF